jgi:hypothetical protein
MKDENNGLLADSYNILNRWKSYFSQLSNVHRVSDVRKTEIHTTGPLAPDPSSSDFEITIANLKRYKSPGSDQIQAELIPAGGETLKSEIHRLINSITNKRKLRKQWKKSIIVPI